MRATRQCQDGRAWTYPTFVVVNSHHPCTRNDKEDLIIVHMMMLTDGRPGWDRNITHILKHTTRNAIQQCPAKERSLAPVIARSLFNRYVVRSPQDHGHGS